MVSIARLDWLSAQISSGREVTVSFSHNSALRREKIKFVMPSNIVAGAPPFRHWLHGAIANIRSAMAHSIVTDKGTHLRMGKQL